MKMDRFMLYCRFTSMQVKANMEYRFNFFMSLFIQVFGYGTTYLGIWVIFDKFDTINGWSYYEVLFLYSLNLLSYGLCAIFVWDPMRRLGRLVQSGEFDNILTRPIDPFFHMLARTISYPFLVQSALAGIVLSICMVHLGLHWSPITVLWFVVFLAGAFLIQCSVFVIAGSLSFWFVNSLMLVDTFIYGIRRFIDYPISLYGAFIQVLLTFIIPYAFVNYYPSLYFLNKSGDTLFSPILQFGTPVVGLVMAALSFVVWKSGLRHYQSTGS